VQFEQLRVLSLQECDEKPGSNARTLRAIASSPWLAGVEKLTLTWLEYVDDEAMAALFASPHLVRVQELHLGALSIGAASARAIQAGALPRSLERLCLDSCALDVEALMSLGSLSTLKELELAECRLPAITKAQASSLGAGMTLRELSLSLAIGIGDEKRITGCVVNRLAAMPALATVERLRLSQYDLDAAAVKSLARLQHRAGLRELNVSSCAITDEDRAALHAAFPGCMIR